MDLILEIENLGTLTRTTDSSQTNRIPEMEGRMPANEDTIEKTDSVKTC